MQGKKGFSKNNNQMGIMVFNCIVLYCIVLYCIALWVMEDG
jgi:hypothetical protein